MHVALVTQTATVSHWYTVADCRADFLLLAASCKIWKDKRGVPRDITRGTRASATHRTCDIELNNSKSLTRNPACNDGALRDRYHLHPSDSPEQRRQDRRLVRLRVDQTLFVYMIHYILLSPTKWRDTDQHLAVRMPCECRAESEMSLQGGRDCCSLLRVQGMQIPVSCDVHYRECGAFQRNTCSSWLPSARRRRQATQCLLPVRTAEKFLWTRTRCKATSRPLTL